MKPLYRHAAAALVLAALASACLPFGSDTNDADEVALASDVASPVGVFGGPRVTTSAEYLAAVNGNGTLDCTSDVTSQMSTCSGDGLEIVVMSISDGRMASVDVTIDESVPDDEALARLVRVAAPLVPAAERGAMAELIADRQRDGYFAKSSEVDGLTLRLNGGPSDEPVTAFALRGYGFVHPDELGVNEPTKPVAASTEPSIPATTRPEPTEKDPTPKPIHSTTAPTPPAEGAPPPGSYACYIPRYNPVTNKLTFSLGMAFDLHADGTYQVPGTSSGTWSFRPSDGRVLFEDEPGIVGTYVGVNSSGHTIELAVDGDEMTCYSDS